MQCLGRQHDLPFSLPFLPWRFPLASGFFLAWPSLAFHWWQRQELPQPLPHYSTALLASYLFQLVQLFSPGFAFPFV